MSVMVKRKLIVLLLFSSIFSETLFFGSFGNNLKNSIIDNYKTPSTLGYNNARDVMYSQIDIAPGNQLVCAYSGYTINLDLSQDPSTDAYEKGINCEHTWPQSMGSSNEPMKSDMHHLFPTKSNVNSSRGNDPFDESDDNLTDKWYRGDSYIQSIPMSNIDEYAEKYNPPNPENERFEPREIQKGNTARAMAYFYTMYSDVADYNFWQIQKDILSDWNYLDPPDEQELSRTWAIASFQDNLPNPFVIDKSLFDRIYFWEMIDKGDINVDRSLDVLDIVAMTNLIINSSVLSNELLYITDINQDDGLNVIDIVAYIQIITGN